MARTSFLNSFQSMGLLILGVTTFTFGSTNPSQAVEPVNPLLKEYTIKIDPTALEPPTHWHVPGMTPLIWTMDPVNMEAYKTTDVKELRLKPGNYRFGTFTFDFLFKVSLSGTLEFSEALDQCVEGRGTQVLKIRCSHTQPYPQDPDYYK